ncbi:secondary thiamine-phosphate synthase enzyme YjbQ [Vibrio rhizosphaerae]|uniref:Secondary thiamine-phosphate synthase enzyme YjbQ n=1 Tax=Vibrio rhizosphaerae TaxID=398736 RepID=A0ABU4IRV5_9VIBR|nr:secondary thiamine-phosphate synthase enzyme YjbQ [Vibrio rhizosphaerae]MDW6092147.1 secondary thiamine-phosphate synthase enzyme YjbQ [Vibrio rhizosphaerae]
MNCIDFNVHSSGHGDFIDITQDICERIKNINVSQGIASIFVRGVTCATVLMRYEEGTKADIKNLLQQLAPIEHKYVHEVTTQDDNGYAHLISSLLGQSLVIPIRDSQLAVSDSHRIIMMDYDPKESMRKVYLSVIG